MRSWIILYFSTYLLSNRVEECIVTVLQKTCTELIEIDVSKTTKVKSIDFGWYFRYYHLKNYIIFTILHSSRNTYYFLPLICSYLKTIKDPFFTLSMDFLGLNSQFHSVNCFLDLSNKKHNLSLIWELFEMLTFKY